jgi:hypothetical protein
LKTVSSKGEAREVTLAGFLFVDNVNNLCEIGNMNKTFKVTWEIELDAESAADAARAALKTQRDPDSYATVFKVEDEQTKETRNIDLFLLDLNPALLTNIPFDSLINPCKIKA